MVKKIDFIMKINLSDKYSNYSICKYLEYVIIYHSKEKRF